MRSSPSCGLIYSTGIPLEIELKDAGTRITEITEVDSELKPLLLPEVSQPQAQGQEQEPRTSACQGCDELEYFKRVHFQGYGAAENAQYIPYYNPPLLGSCP